MQQISIVYDVIYNIHIRPEYVLLEFNYTTIKIVNF